MGNLDIPPDQWLKKLFECHYCDECTGDAEHHTAIVFVGNWFARCDYPRHEETDKLHPVVAAFHKENGNEDIH